MIVYSPDAAALAPLRATVDDLFSGSCDRIASAETEAELMALLEEHPVRLVLATTGGHLVETMRRHRRELRVAFVGDPSRTELVEAARAGYDVRHAASDSIIAELVRDALGDQRPRPARAHAPGLRLHDAGLGRDYPIADLSSHGFSYLVPVEEGIDDHYAGRIFEGFCLRRGEAVALDQGSAVVRYVRAEGTGYRVGCELRRTWLQGRSPATVLRDGLQCRALFADALQDGGVLLESDREPGLRVLLDESRARLEGDLVVADTFHRFSNLEAVRGSFELGGREHTFTTVVMGESPLAVRLPASLAVTRGPAGPLYRPPQDAPIRLELTCHLWQVPVQVRAAEAVAADAVVFHLAAGAGPLPEGAVFESVLLHFGRRTLRARGRVVSLTIHPKSPGDHRCVVALEYATPQDRRAVVDALTERRFPCIQDGGDVTGDELVELYRETKYLTPAHEKVIAPALPEIRSTLATLGAARSDLFKAVALREDGKLVGYMSGIRVYSGTFMWQHLAARPGRATARSLILSLIAHRIEEDAFEYVKFWFLKDNPYPMKVFATMGRKLIEADKQQMQLFAHVPLATGKALDERLARPGMDVRVATDADLAVVERYLVAREHPLVVRADDLTQKQLRLAALGDRYASLGLVRRREVLVASYRGHRVGFALAERASHGLNLYGGLSSFRVYVTSDEGELADATRLALLQALQGHYAAAGQQSSMGLVPVEHAPSYERLGLTVPAQSYCLTMHRSVVPVALSHVDRVTRK